MRAAAQLSDTQATAHRASAMITRAMHNPQRIGVGIDGSIESHAAVRWAIDHARPGDTVTLLYAWRPSPSSVEVGLTASDDDSGARAFVRHEFARIKELPHEPGVTVAAEVLHGDPRELFCAADVDLLVVGAGGHGALVGALLGSVSAHLARRARVPVVIVPNPRAQPVTDDVRAEALQ